MFNEINVNLFYFFNHSLQNPIFDSVMPILSHFGGFKFLLIILVVIIIYAHIKRKETLKNMAILSLGALLFAGALTAGLKYLVHEPRPSVILDNVRVLFVENDPFAFPSGHSASTWAVVMFLVLNMKELAEKHYKVIDTALIVFAIAIPFSRMYVGVHLPFDVLAGCIIGICCALIVNRYKNEILKIVNRF